MNNTTITTQGLSTAPATTAEREEYLALLHEAENNTRRLRYLLGELIELMPQLLGTQGQHEHPGRQ